MLAIALLSIVPLIHPDVEVCGVGTSGEAYHHERLAELQRTARPRIDTHAQPSIRLEDGLVVLTADDRTAAGWKRFDLVAQTLRFTPVASGGFVVSRGAVVTKPRGQRFDRGGAWSAKYTTASFAFPFGGESVRELFIAPSTSIHFTPVEADVESFQFSANQGLSMGGIIAPLLSTARGMKGTPEIFVRDTNDSVAVTWVATTVGYLNFEVRAELFRDGVIEFAYIKADQPPFGAVAVVTTGKEAWRDETIEVAAATDISGDTRTHDVTASMLDIVGARVTRNRGGRLSFEVELREEIDFAKVPEGRHVSVGFTVTGGGYFFVDADNTGITRVQRPNSGVTNPATIQGRVVSFDTLETNFQAAARRDVRISTSLMQGSSGVSVDDITFAFDTPPPFAIESDFSALPSGTTMQGPIVETFTVPSLSEGTVWITLQQTYGLRDDEWDALAVYQNFDTELVLWAAGSSGFGNPMVQGISNAPVIGTSLRPNMMNLGRVDRSPTLQTPRAHLLLHEFGHRWLFYPYYHEGGKTSAALLGAQLAHPHDLVDTRAAFPHADPRDYSVMGGSWIEAKGELFVRAGLDTSAGYSWLDLYLMGLADASEVPPFFHIANATWVDFGTYRGTRIEVTLPQIAEAMGRREPAYPATKRDFKVAFVLLTDPLRPPTAAEIALVKTYRALFERDFALATGGRATVSTRIQAMPNRRRATPH